MIKFGVMIICEKEETKHMLPATSHNYVETDTLFGVARVISTFKPKRGYKVVKIMVDESEVMDLEVQPYVKTGLLEMEKDSILENSKG